MLKILLGGSPCTHWSCAKRENRETTPSGEGWELFLNYVIAREKFQPDIFLYENNVSASKAIKEAIKKYLNVDNETIFYDEFNSELVSAQKRNRLYVHNCGQIEQPKDRGISFQSILENGLAATFKSYCLTASYGGAVVWNSFERSQRSMVAIPAESGVYNCDNGKLYINGNYYSTLLPTGRYNFRKLTAVECARLQTMPDNYCSMVSTTQAYKCLGNGWTAAIIEHILSARLADVSRDEEIVVLSMYDGIGTGLEVLKRMGFTNITYYAFEIDKFAMKVANTNHPEIIQCGDAFQIRNDINLLIKFEPIGGDSNGNS